MTLNIEKAGKSPMNIITELSADTFVWLRAKRYFNKKKNLKTCTGRVCEPVSWAEYSQAASY